MQAIAEIVKPITTRNTQSKPCRLCGKEFVPDFLPHLVNVCRECSERESIEEGRRMAREAHQRRVRAWENICPDEYRNTEPSKLPKPELLPRVMRWNYGPRGLLLHGPTGRGKSRIAWLLLKREHDAGRRVVAVDHSIGFRYAETFAQSAAEAALWIDRLSSAELLFLDDVFKARLTDSLEQALFTVIAGRCEERRPIIVTTNDTGASLLDRMSSDRGAALIRRLMEYNERIACV